MGLESLSWSYSSTGETIFDPTTLTSASSISVTITNFGVDDITDIGLYITPASTLGDVDYPADSPPETDYQDLIKWGEETTSGVAVSGGLRLQIPQNDGSIASRYVTRTAGNTSQTKLSMKDLVAGDSAIVTLEIQTPPAVSARRLYISLAADITE